MRKANTISTVRPVGQTLRPALFAAMLVLLLGLTACGAKRDTVVLLPDLDGTVGVISVKGSRGEVVVDQPMRGVTVDGRTRQPSQPFDVSEQELRKDYGAALDAAPMPPARFILYFRTGGTMLTVESEALIPDILAEIQSRRSTDVSVVGHADRTGSREGNMRLSTRRAQAVAQLLEDQGVSETVLQITSHGEENPLVPTPDDVAEPRNRRVEVTVR